MTIMCASRRLLATIIVALVPVSMVQAAPVIPSASDDMICDTDPVRPDRDPTLHEQIAMTTRGAIGYYRFGKGNPLILITGYRANLSEWNAYFIAELAKNHEVVVFDNRGIGRSASNLVDYRALTLARDTSALIKALGFSSSTVLGWSMGGMVAQRLALEDPELVDHLILLNSAPPGPSSIAVPDSVEDILSGRGQSSFDSVMSVLFPVAEEQRARDCFAKDMFRPKDYGKERVSRAVTVAQDDLVQNWQEDKQSFDRLSGLKVRTLVLGGTEDEVLDRRNSVVLAQTIPNAGLIEISGGGHAMMYQYPRLLANRIDVFMQH